MSGDRSQRTEQQTARRRKENRRKGQVARSATLVSWVSLLIASAVVPRAAAGIAELLADGLLEIGAVAADPEPAVLLAAGRSLCLSVAAALAPVMLAAAAVAVLGNLAQVGFVLTATPLTPKLERLDPIKGIKRLFSAKSLWETGKQVVTISVILALAVPSVSGLANSLLGSSWALGPALSELGRSIVLLVRIVALVGSLIGVADYGWSRYSLMRDQRMTKEEVRREHRESEGDPHLKAKLQSNRVAMSRNRMLASVGDADVVITNPTHVAVALRYRPALGAPRVVATGVDAMASRIRARASEAGVPMVSSPPLARALHRACRVDDEVPVELFRAVATVLAFVQRLGGSGGTPIPLPVADTWTRPGEGPEPRRGRSGRRTALDRAQQGHLQRPRPHPAGTVAD
jgi:flagellar biosynthesis protein FlhB